MRQYAWLDFHGGCWHLVTKNRRDRDRKWTNRESALSDLSAEGWVIGGPQGKQLTMHDADWHSYGYRLSRTIH
jgi:hypothetical protein